MYIYLLNLLTAFVSIYQQNSYLIKKEIEENCVTYILKGNPIRHRLKKNPNSVLVLNGILRIELRSVSLGQK